MAAGGPLHRLAEGDAVDDRVSRTSSGWPGTLDAEEAVALLELVGRPAVAAREALASLVGRGHGRPLDPDGRSRIGQVLDDQHEPARPDEDLRRLGAQVLPRELRQLRLGLAAGRRRQLLAADLKQQAGQRSPRRAARPRARGSARGRCRRRARSPRSRRARRAG